MNSAWFDGAVKPFLKGCTLEYLEFANGDFGDLERIEIEGVNKLGTVEFWSKGWIGIDVYDCVFDSQIMNVLLSPEEAESVHQAFEDLIRVLTNG